MYFDFSAVFSATRSCNLSAFKLADFPLGPKKAAAGLPKVSLALASGPLHCTLN